MTSASPVLSASVPEKGRETWAARVAELVLIGGGTLLLFPLSWLFQRKAGLDSAEGTIDFVAYYAAFVINNPHFAVTYLLFYKDARSRALGGAFPKMQRARYVIAGFVVPALLLTWGLRAVTTGSAYSLGLLIQLMFLLVGWHYVKQGFGILMVLSARRGVRFGAWERRIILAHCYAGWAYAWASPFDPGRELMEKGVIFTSIAHPPWLERFTAAVFALSAVALAAVLIRKWRLEKKLPPLIPLTGYLVTIWLWLVYSSADRLMMYVIPALHSIQYLYFVWLLRRNQAKEAEGPPDFGKPAPIVLATLAGSAIVLAWLLFHGIPGFLDERLVLGAAPEAAPSDLGTTPYFAALFVVVNIHHYFMDSVIWRRENPETRYLQKV